MKFDYSYHYRKWHSDSADHRQKMIEYYQTMLQSYLTPDHSSPILDIGCGMGFALQTLQRLGYSDIHGVDSDPGQVESCRKFGLDVALTGNTLEFLHNKKNAYGQILALDLIEHIPIKEQIEFVEGIWAALRVGGSLLCTVPNANSALAMRYRYIDWTHHCSFTEHSLDFLLHTSGFREIRIAPYEVLPRPRWWFLPLASSKRWWAFKFVRAFRRLECMTELGPKQGREIPLSLNLVAVARKI